MSDSWEARMAARAAERAAAERVDDPPRPVPTTREEAEQIRADYCVDCAEVYEDPWWGWQTRLSCGFFERPSRCSHEHHYDEIWMAAG